MRELDVVSFSISLTDEITKLKGLLFKVIKHKSKYYISKFDDVIITEITPINLNNDASDYLDNLPNNYSYITTFDRRNHFAMIESKRVFGIKTGIEKLHFYFEDELPNSVITYKTFDNANAILAYCHIYDKSESAFLIESKTRNKAFPIIRKVEYDSSNEHKEQTLLYLESKEKGIKTENYQTFLLVGDINFSDTKEYVSEMDRLSLYHIQADVQNYLNLWKEYNRIELEREYTQFKKSSFVRFDSITYGDDIKLYFNNEEFVKLTKFFIDKMCFVGGKELLHLFNSKDFDSYNKIEKELLSEEKLTVVELNTNGVNSTEKSIKVKTSDRAFFRNINNGNICLSLLGNKISYQRREKAKERIITGKAGIQKMYTWFTDNPEPNEKPERIEIDSTLLPNTNLTPNQIEAIKVILNTPDFVIIVGPPGTGKTTVIKAALIQLNALTGNKYNFGNNLLSGFRHETVLNLTENIDLFGLPAVKVGDKDNSNSEELEPRIIEFIEKLIDALKEKYSTLTESDDEYIEFKKKYFNYISFNNSIDSSIEILNGISKLDIFISNQEVNEKINKMIKSLKQQNNSLSYEEHSFVNFLYGMPISEEAYKDDRERIEIELSIFEDYNSLKEDVKKLEKAYTKKPYSSDLVKVLRRDLILKYRKQPEILTSPAKKQEIIDYLNYLFDIIKCERLKKFDGDKIAVLDYIDSLTENPYLIRETLLAYTKVLGATNQQTISKNMYLIKNDDVMFDNVFIDEAATSSPLDLFIPMSVAKKKIILVGDHKQLPNITDEDIIDEIEDDLNKNSDDSEYKNISSTMKKTLFEILIEKAHQLEAKDGVKRVIMLDTQFRMHPKLGEIVSNSFYEGMIKSVRPESDFNHNYHNLKNKYLYWLDTPYDDYYKNDYGEKGSHSRKNVPEAKKIAKHIKEALDDKNYTKLSIGVITIYRDQVKTIKEELKKIGVLDEKYALLPLYDSQELLIGTVDAFQGREFDIVYLSLVYTFNKDKNYSRLANENSKSLLCVALSRQRKMLIVVGDMSVYNIPKAKEKVRPLYDLAIQCSGGDSHE